MLIGNQRAQYQALVVQRLWLSNSKFAENLRFYQYKLQKLMSRIQGSRTADQIESKLDQTVAQMHEHQKNGNYVEAQNCRLSSEQLKKDLEARRVYQMENRHAKEHEDLNHTHQQELANFNSFWEKKMSEYNQESQKMIQDLLAKHEKDEEHLRADLDKQLSYKVKESSECLNLRKMQEHMAKQKNYVEAHKVQQRVNELQKTEKDAWIEMRKMKIQTSVNTLKSKQAAQLAALNKKIKSGFDEQNKERYVQETRLHQKYGNIDKELKANHDKQILAFKGHFRSKGGQGSPLLTKSKHLTR